MKRTPRHRKLRDDSVIDRWLRSTDNTTVDRWTTSPDDPRVIDAWLDSILSDDEIVPDLSEDPDEEDPS